MMNSQYDVNVGLSFLFFLYSYLSLRIYNIQFNNQKLQWNLANMCEENFVVFSGRVYLQEGSNKEDPKWGQIGKAKKFLNPLQAKDYADSLGDCKIFCLEKGSPRIEYKWSAKQKVFLQIYL